MRVNDHQRSHYSCTARLYVEKVTKDMLGAADNLDSMFPIVYVGNRDWSFLDAWEQAHVLITAREYRRVSFSALLGLRLADAWLPNFEGNREGLPKDTAGPKCSQCRGSSTKPAA